MTDLVALESDLRSALAREVRRRRRRARRVTITAAVAGAMSAFCAAAFASGIADDLSLDPSKWSVLGGGTVDNGRGKYVHAQDKEDGGNSTFMVEHDAGLPPYRAFLLHEQTLAAAEQTSPVPVRPEQGALCTADELTHAESVALAALRAQFPTGTDADLVKPAVAAAIDAAFDGGQCRGLEYAGEQARLFYAGVMPADKLMPGVR
jgi:hypothetical protein